MTPGDIAPHVGKAGNLALDPPRFTVDIADFFAPA